jgi:hypothetical protein
LLAFEQDKYKTNNFIKKQKNKICFNFLLKCLERTSKCLLVLPGRGCSDTLRRGQRSEKITLFLVRGYPSGLSRAKNADRCFVLLLQGQMAFEPAPASLI